MGNLAERFLNHLEDRMAVDRLITVIHNVAVNKSNQTLSVEPEVVQMEKILEIARSSNSSPPWEMLVNQTLELIGEDVLSPMFELVIRRLGPGSQDFGHLLVVYALFVDVVNIRMQQDKPTNMAEAWKIHDVIQEIFDPSVLTGVLAIIQSQNL